MNTWAWWITYDSEPIRGPFDSEIEAYDYRDEYLESDYDVELRDFPYDEELAP